MHMCQPFRKNVHKKFPYTNPYHVLTSETVHVSTECGMTSRPRTSARAKCACPRCSRRSNCPSLPYLGILSSRIKVKGQVYWDISIRNQIFNDTTTCMRMQWILRLLFPSPAHQSGCLGTRLSLRELVFVPVTDWSWLMSWDLQFTKLEWPVAYPWECVVKYFMLMSMEPCWGTFRITDVPYYDSNNINIAHSCTVDVGLA